MDILEQIALKKEKNLILLSNIGKNSISKRLKYFIDEIIIMDKTFSRAEQAKIFETLLDMKIEYQSYISFFKRNVESKLENKES